MNFRLFAPALLLCTSAFAAEIDDALALFRAKNYPAAREALEKITQADPKNAVAAHHLGLTLIRRGDTAALKEALPWLEKATVLDATKAAYWHEYGNASLVLAGRETSLSAATKGRDALEKSLTIDPDNLDAREGLFQFYSRAPWPIGSSSKAKAQLEEIRKRDPNRGFVLNVISLVSTKDYAAAFQVCDEAIAKNPDNYNALYQYGRAAAISELNLTTGLTHLQKCLTLTPPNPNSLGHTHVWTRIGNLHEKLKRPAEARAAYESALKVDANNKAAADALAKLR